MGVLYDKGNSSSCGRILVLIPYQQAILYSKADTAGMCKDLENMDEEKLPGSGRKAFWAICEQFVHPHPLGLLRTLRLLERLRHMGLLAVNYTVL